VKIPLESVERAMAQLWDQEARRTGAPRIELMTLVALVAETALVERAHQGIAHFAALHPSRTILAKWSDAAEDGITAEVALHRSGKDGPACGDAILLEATGSGRDWLPDNVERLALADLPVCLWWVGDLPDFDHLLDRMLSCADLVVVNSGEMDLRDLLKLSEIVSRSRDRYALSDLTWVRLHPLQELVARFFDDEASRGHLQSLHRVTVEFSPREGDTDVTSTQAGLFFGWMAHALRLRPDSVHWEKGDGWAQAAFDRVVARFERRPRPDVPPGTIIRVAMDCGSALFDIERQVDPCVFRWSREVPGATLPPQMLRLAIQSEPTLLAQSLATPKRDRLLEASLHVASRIVQPVAPRLSSRPGR
jgi:glucose-6-phosphate dehydrogenase assembly protein OpcA